MSKLLYIFNLHTFYLLLGFGITIHILSLLLGLTIFADWRFVNEPVHSSLEMGGSLVACFVAYFLLIYEKTKDRITGSHWIASSILAIGILDGFHAFTHAGEAFVWLHSIATFVGGALFLTVWIPDTSCSDRLIKRLPMWTIFGSISLGIFSLVFVDLLPTMLENGKFSFVAKFLNIAGGLCFFTASIKLFLNYKISKNVDGLLFFLNCILFGAAAVLFEQSQLWDFTWWGWHVLRVLAYATALFFIINTIRRIEQIDFDRYKLQLDLTALVSETDVSGNITYVNSKFCEVLKYSERELIGKNHNIINSGFHSKEFWQIFWETISNGIPWQGEICNRAKDGNLFWLQSTILPIFSTHKKIIGYSSIQIDITEKKEADYKIQHKAKLASIGEMAASIGHEINNPLAIMMGNIDLLEKILVNNSSNNIERRLSKIKEAQSRIRKIVDGLRTFSRSNDLSVETISINQQIIQTVNLISEMYKNSGISINLNIPDNELFCKGNTGKLQQVIMNLISNARDATDAKEKREITVSLVKSDINTATFSVKDNGCGIKDEIRNKILEPFFTTKKEGVGTGIGLGLVNNIVHEMNGTLDIDTELDKGSTFSVSLPLVSDEALIEKEDVKNEITQLTGTVLVVDDEPEIREILSLYLEDIGLYVDTANDGLMAYEKIKLKKYDYVCTDLQMPQMNGYELINAAKKLKDRDSKYIVVTGGIIANSTDKKTSQLLSNVDKFIEKPFSEKLIHEVFRDLAIQKKN